MKGSAACHLAVSGAGCVWGSCPAHPGDPAVHRASPGPDATCRGPSGTVCSLTEVSTSLKGRCLWTTLRSPGLFLRVPGRGC